jgi:hypothetical protein
VMDVPLAAVRLSPGGLHRVLGVARYTHDG